MMPAARSTDTETRSKMIKSFMSPERKRAMRSGNVAESVVELPAIGPADTDKDGGFNCSEFALSVHDEI
jgi:hypothetical protein